MKYSMLETEVIGSQRIPFDKRKLKGRSQTVAYITDSNENSLKIVLKVMINNGEMVTKVLP